MKTQYVTTAVVLNANLYKNNVCPVLHRSLLQNLKLFLFYCDQLFMVYVREGKKHSQGLTQE